MEMIVQKAVELGVAEIVPVAMKRCIVKLDAKKAAKKVSRWNTIALSAAKQAKRGIIPEVREVRNFKDILEEVQDIEFMLVPYEEAKGDAGIQRTDQSGKREEINRDHHRTRRRF